MTRFFDGVLSLFEWLAALVMIVGGISLFFSDPVTTGGPIVRLLGSAAAGYIYGTGFITAGAFLMIGKAFKKTKIRKNSLMAIYLISIFTFLLEYALIGWTVYLIDSAVLFVVIGAAWLRLKVKTEYIDPKHFAEHFDNLNQHARKP